MSRARTSDDIWWARIFDRLDEFLHNYPKFRDNTTGEVYIIDMTSAVHGDIITRLQNFFEVPNNGVVDNPPIVVTGQVLHYVPGGNRVETAPSACVRPDVAFVPKPAASTVIPRPPGDTCGNPHARIMCEVTVGRSVGESGRKCLSWMREPYVRAVISIKILEPRLNMQEPTTGYFYRTMTAKLYRQGMPVQRWDFGNIKKYSRDPITDPPGCNAPNLAAYRITIPISEVFWDPPSPIPPGYTPAIPPNVVGINFVIDLYRIQRVALQAQTP
ncbi:558_t:CDS:2 [Rhizophagus irregularis]|nr:558_t:CDS:2 [Rhizophagus irregularis]